MTGARHTEAYLYNTGFAGESCRDMRDDHISLAFLLQLEDCHRRSVIAVGTRAEVFLAIGFPDWHMDEGFLDAEVRPARRIDSKG